MIEQPESDPAGATPVEKGKAESAPKSSADGSQGIGAASERELKRLPLAAEAYWRELCADDRGEIFGFTNREVRLLFREIDALRAAESRASQLQQQLDFMRTRDLHATEVIEARNVRLSELAAERDDWRQVYDELVTVLGLDPDEGDRNGAVAALTDLQLRASQLPSWQAMATAPKDGTLFIGLTKRGTIHGIKWDGAGSDRDWWFAKSIATTYQTDELAGWIPAPPPSQEPT